VIEPRGGSTIAQLWKVADDPKTDPPVAIGKARCSRLDNYNRAIGRAIAFGRAVYNYELSLLTPEQLRERAAALRMMNPDVGAAEYEARCEKALDLERRAGASEVPS
jgi:hypothetical protein